jgi:hypothetical protein
MTSTTSKQPEAQLSSLQTLSNLYTTLAAEFMIELPALKSTASADDIRTWLKDADARIPVHQFRQFLQTSRLANRETLAAAIDYCLSKQKKDEGDRDKIDFLLVQILSLCASSQLQEADASLEFVARTLEPFLGAVEAALTEPLRPLEALLKSANGCKSLQELYNSGILEQSRKIKVALGDRYFEPQILVGTTRFNFLMRRAFFQLMHRDLNVVLEGLRKLELKGLKVLDCRKAEFAEDEPISRLRMICQSWKVMFQAEYSSGQPLRLLADLRGVVDAKLAETLGKGAPAKAEGAAKTEAKSEPKPEAKFEAKVEAKTEAKTEATTEVKADSKPETKSEAKPAATVTQPATSSMQPSAGSEAGKTQAAAASAGSSATGIPSKNLPPQNSQNKNDRRGKRK